MRKRAKTKRTIPGQTVDKGKQARQAAAEFSNDRNGFAPRLGRVRSRRPTDSSGSAAIFEGGNEEPNAN